MRVGGVFGVSGGGVNEMRFPHSDWRGIRKREMVEKDKRGFVVELEVEPLDVEGSVVVKIESSGT